MTQNAEMRTKMTSSLVSDTLEKAETVTSAYLPNLEIALENSAQEPDGQSKSELGKRNAVEFIQREPTILLTNMDQNEKRELYDLISTCQFHTCSAYCTKNGTILCKSSFPFQANEESTLKSFLDANGDEQFRVHLRRNNTGINPFSHSIINIWRANMDLQLICGSSFAQLMYVAYYTSKTEEMADIKGVTNK